jgi:hypothetical protein
MAKLAIGNNNPKGLTKSASTKAFVAVSLCLAVCVTACDGKGTANVKCGDIQAFESRLGTFNAPHFSIGKVFAVQQNAAGFTAFPVSSLVALSDAQEVKDTPVAKESDTFSSQVSITFDAKVPVAIQANLSSLIKDSTKFSVTNLQRNSIVDPVAALKAQPSVVAAMKAAMEHNPNAVLYLVHSVLTADSMDVGVDSSVTNSATANVVKFGSFELEVSYACSEAVHQSGAQFNALFKAVPINFDASGTPYINMAASVDFTKVTFNATR